MKWLVWHRGSTWVFLALGAVTLGGLAYGIYRVYQTTVRVRRGHEEQGIELTDAEPAKLSPEEVSPAQVPTALESVHISSSSTTDRVHCLRIPPS